MGHSTSGFCSSLVNHNSSLSCQLAAFFYKKLHKLVLISHKVCDKVIIIIFIVTRTSWNTFQASFCQGGIPLLQLLFLMESVFPFNRLN